MTSVEKIMLSLKRNPKNARFSDAIKVGERYFGEPRIHGSHYVFRVPWADNPRVNIQNRGGFAPPYQVKQPLAAIERMESHHG